MINTKGEWIYTNAEIAYELGLSLATVNDIGKRLYGNKIPHWTIDEVRRIIEYIKSITIEEDEKRLNLLRETIKECGYEKQDDENVMKHVAKVLHRID
ncbi:MAG TPA: hypothetical protein PKI14_01205 [Fervidobacterium sp.]|nr:hypothetical protein [Fervidobacterium sp.]